MCWGVPAKVLSVEGLTALVDFGGVQKEVLVAAKGIAPNDLVMIHAGMAIGKLSLKDFMENVALYRDILSQEFQETGMGKGAAEEKATGEINKLLETLGIDESVENVKPEEMEEMAEEKEIRVPDAAFRRKYKISLSDTDYLQVMHYTNYFRFCERAQQELLDELGFSYATLIHKFGIFIPTVETTGKILAPVRIDNEIEVAVWVEEIGRKHIKFRNIVKNLTSGKIAADCLTVAVCTDVSITGSMLLPPDLAEKLKSRLVKAG